jgi:hypothetical protein
MNASEHIAKAELSMESFTESVVAPSDVVVSLVQAHALISIAQSLERLADGLDLKIDLDRR